MAQNDMLKILLQNDKILKQAVTKEVTPMASITIPYTSLTFSGLTVGAVFRATGATSAAFGQVDLADTDAVTGTLAAARLGASPTATKLLFGDNTWSVLADTDIPNLDASKITTGTLAAARGGTGVSNGASATLTLPNTGTTVTGGGTLALGGFTFTVPATGTAVLLATTQTISGSKTFSVNIEADAGINVGTGTGAGTGEITTSGSVGFGDAVQGNIRLYSKGVDATSSNWAFVANSSAGTNLFWVRNDGYILVSKSGGTLGFFGGTNQAKQTITGSRAGNAALASLLTALANHGLITDSSTA